MNAVAGWLLIRAEDGFNPANVAVSFFYNLPDDEGLLDSTGVDGSPLGGVLLLSHRAIFFGSRYGSGSPPAVTTAEFAHAGESRVCCMHGDEDDLD